MPFSGYVLIPAFVLAAALVLDRCLGDPHTPFHPVALIGRVIGWWGRPSVYRPGIQRLAGIICWAGTSLLFTLPFLLVEWFAPWWLYLLAGPFLLKSTFAWRSLEEHASSVEAGLATDPGAGRTAASMMVSRNTETLSDEEVRSAAYESVAENLVDSILAPLFWFAILGLPGAALYRAANTMDAMLGYRDERERLGWFPARADDLLSYIPARIAGCLLLCWFGVYGRGRDAFSILRRDARKRPGPNGGIPMAAIAGGCGIAFTKPGGYLIGEPARSLLKGGSCVIAAVRGVTLFFAFLLLLIWILPGLSLISPLLWG
ncbi:MAG: cobalamin biosynthesis protein CobD [Methanocalculus sp. MSAO_Arc1]|uniref:adenosylcobinamide-phosphate synthase CbiB n=1 Tax=Methanocalculus TaxID=71151 RepID=UPI000FED283E|nr:MULTISPECIES: adenosylcobinamide-phosphate synthase CbiB [unclassified Methanocalculus]MCP1661610.1 adenosylcobinamide-phosphate synthase [Methanocalculus sp. AMF5]RQD81309.1 MAG: cobalamin biosynthesis protein CobD [Methanocalculus sp. MSAO_Arc1]